MKKYLVVTLLVFLMLVPLAASGAQEEKEESGYPGEMDAWHEKRNWASTKVNRTGMRSSRKQKKRVK